MVAVEAVMVRDSVAGEGTGDWMPSKIPLKVDLEQGDVGGKRWNEENGLGRCGRRQR